MERIVPFLSLGLAVAAGLLIGLERERSAPKDPKIAMRLSRCGAAHARLGVRRGEPLVRARPRTRIWIERISGTRT